MIRRWICLAGLSGLCTFAQTTADVGSGAATPGIRSAFIQAWLRNGFNTLVGEPSANVAKYGSTGLIQQFPSVASATTTLALVKPDATENPNVFQVLAGMFSFYGSVSVGTAGYPISDTLSCPALKSGTAINCVWQQFTNNYALFVYTGAAQGTAQNFATRDPYFTKWNNLGGTSGLGPANSAETQITSLYKSQATFQTFDQGAVYNLTAGVYSGRILAIKEPVWDVYVSNGAASGSLGLPVTDALLLPNGMLQQNFESGAIQYNPSTGVAVLRPPVSSIALTPSGSVHLNAGDTLAAQASLYANDGSTLTDRTVNWNTSNGQIVQIQANGLQAAIKAVGAGTASVTVFVDGRTSPALIVSVTAPCCRIGEGAPTQAIQAAFTSAVTRNSLSVQLPAASAVVRIGKGYVQSLLSTDVVPVPYLLAVPDGSVTGFVVAGAILSQYTFLGGPAGVLGYPLSDATTGGRQPFQQGTLAGSPVQMVTGAILTKWGSLGFETGVAGSPTSAAAAFQTFRGTSGNMQSFQNALIVTPTTGAFAGQAFVVTGQVLQSYNSLQGPKGDLGAPTDDEHPVNGLRQQDFEGGSINFASGSSAANVVKSPRQPLLTATPASAQPGSPVHLVVGGFANGVTLRVSQTGQQDFLVTAANGTYAWDVWIPAAAAGGAVTVLATDTKSAASAQTSYTVRSAASASVTASIASGDQQSGAPGALLAQPLVVMVKDQNGNPMAGQTVNFAASPGAQIAPASAATGANGQANAVLRLPSAAGIALATAQAGRSTVTFSAKSAAFSLSNFPALSQAVNGALGNGNDSIQNKGALLTATASILRYHQLRGELPAPNGLADPVSLNQFLKSFCVFDSQTNQICDGFISLGSSQEQTVNLWRAGAFVSNSLDIEVEATDLNVVRDLVVSGSPVLLTLSLNGLGSHFVVATGIAADGSLIVADPNPAYAQSNLNAYLSGFTAASGKIQGTVSGVVRLVPQTPASPGFLVVSSAPPTISSVAGACGRTLQFPDTAGANTSGTLYFRSCDGTADAYEVDLSSKGPVNATITDLSSNPARTALSAASALIVRNGSRWTVGPVAASFTSAGIVNAASFTSDTAPGGLVSIYGAGLVSGNSTTTMQVNGKPATVLAAFPFQVNAQIPLDAPPGPATLSISSGSTSAQQPFTIGKVAPAIFSVGVGQAAITNQDNRLNTPSNPAVRGSTVVIYGTGFGAVSTVGKLSVSSTPVAAVIGGIEIAAAFAGLSPGAIGLYQANIALPVALPPGLSLPLYLKQGTVVSNTVLVAIQ